jgi:hypothetical protein
MVELKPGERRIDRTRPERHQLCGDPIVKNVVLGGILMPALEQDLAAFPTTRPVARRKLRTLNSCVRRS